MWLTSNRATFMPTKVSELVFGNAQPRVSSTNTGISELKLRRLSSRAMNVPLTGLPGTNCPCPELSNALACSRALCVSVIGSCVQSRREGRFTAVERVADFQDWQRIVQHQHEGLACRRKPHRHPRCRGIGAAGVALPAPGVGVIKTWLVCQRIRLAASVASKKKSGSFCGGFGWQDVIHAVNGQHVRARLQQIEVGD